MEQQRIDPKWNQALHGLSHAEAEAVHGLMRARSYAPRSLIFSQGEPSDTLVVVRNGRVRLFIISPEGDEFTFSMLTGGSILGLAAAVLQRPRILSVEAAGPVDVSILSTFDFAACLERIPRFSHNITRLLALLAVENIERSAPLVLDSASQRLGRILVALATRTPGGKQAVHDLTHDDLGKMIGASRTWVSLTLADFERRGLVNRQPGCIAILDPAGLTR